MVSVLEGFHCNYFSIFCPHSNSACAAFRVNVHLRNDVRRIIHVAVDVSVNDTRGYIECPVYLPLSLSPCTTIAMTLRGGGKGPRLNVIMTLI